MAGEMLLINPRRRKHKTRSRRKTKSRRKARSMFARINPRRRTRRAASRRRTHRSRRSRVHRNPRLPLIGSVNLTAIGSGAAGYIGTRYATGWLLSMLPASMVADPAKAPVVRIGIKALVGIVGLPMLAKALKLKGVAGPLAIGAGIATVVDLFETFVAKNIPFAMADYEQGYISAYEGGTLTGGQELMDGGEGVYETGAY